MLLPLVVAYKNCYIERENRIDVLQYKADQQLHGSLDIPLKKPFESGFGNRMKDWEFAIKLSCLLTFDL